MATRPAEVLTPLEDAEVLAALRLYASLTDGPDLAAPVAQRFVQALRQSSGDAALEVGVRAGGMSAIFCQLAAALHRGDFMVLSVDPWGCAPYFEAGRDVSSVLRYDDHFYAVARQLLGRFPNNMLFRLDADTFLDHLLPHLRWWIAHVAYPRATPFLSFVYLDGRHDARSVIGEVLRILPYLVDHGCIVVDNVDKCPEACQFLSSIPGLTQERLPGHRVALTRRAA